MSMQHPKRGTPSADQPCCSTPTAPAAVERPVDCAHIQHLLLAYLARELGDGQSQLLHEHLRHCPACSREAVGLQETIELLHGRDPADGVPSRLSAGRHRALQRTVTHPVLAWIFAHHWLVALLTSLALTGLALWLLLRIGPGEAGTPIWVRVLGGA